VLLCNQSLTSSEGGGAALDAWINGLTEAQLKGGWQPLEASEEHRRALLPQTPALPWDDLMLRPDYMHALTLVP
jgi:beta-N-acetylhexosaminidase